MKITRRKTLFALGALAFIGLAVHRQTRRDEFFPNFGVNVPQAAIQSHQTQWGLNSESHEIILQLPGSVWKPILKNFAGKARFRDWSNGLSSSYTQFRAGHEAFFPTLPAQASAGEFWAFGKDGENYICRFLRDNNTGQVWFFGWSPDN